MKKFLLTFSLLGFLGISSVGITEKSFAAESANDYSENVMPKEVQDALKIEQQPEFEDVNKRDYPQYNPNYSIENSNRNEISTFATTAYPGAYTSDSQTSKYLGQKGTNVIFGEITDSGISTFAYYTFGGWGYTGYSGSGTIQDITSTVYAKSAGVSPSISTGGISWAPIIGSVEVAHADRDKSTDKFAQAAYSNVKIQNILNAVAIFENKSYAKVSGVGSETWTEDIWFWF